MDGQLHLGSTFTHRLHTLNKLTDRVSSAAYLQAVDTPLSEARCLTAVGGFEPLSLNDLARRANLNKGQASRAAQALVDQGLVRKAPSATDGRGVVLTLSAKGRRRCNRVMQVVQQRNQDILSCLSATERERLLGYMDRLVAHARQATGEVDDDLTEWPGQRTAI